MEVHDDPAQVGAGPGARDRLCCRPGQNAAIPAEGGRGLLQITDYLAALAQVEHHLPDDPAGGSIGPAALPALFLDVLDYLVRIRPVRGGHPRRAGTRPPLPGIGGRGCVPGGGSLLLLYGAPVRPSLLGEERGLAGGVVVVFVDGQLPQSIPQLGLQVLDGFVGLIKPFGQPLDLLGQDARVLRPPLQNSVVRLPGPDQLEPQQPLLVFLGVHGVGGFVPRSESFGLGAPHAQCIGQTIDWLASARRAWPLYNGGERLLPAPETQLVTLIFRILWAADPVPGR